MRTKLASLAGLKAGPGDGLGEKEFTAYASTWTRVPDAYGDVVAKGAFAQTIKEWAASGNTVPILYGHNSADPYTNVAAAVDLSEDDHGLLVHGKFDDAPAAEQVYSLVKSKRLSQLSFAYDAIDQGPVDLAGGEKANELRQVKLYEVSLVPVGANQDTEVLAVKSTPTNRAATQTLALRLAILSART